jgi:Family of unknown function (DUF5958)
MFTLEDDILVNQWVQNVQSTTVIFEWFESSSAERKLEILRYLVSLCKQARATNDEGQQAILDSSLNPRRSASVLLAKGTNVEILHKLSTLRNVDGGDAFILLLHLLRIADRRRKSAENPERCNHWWHRDLGDPVVLDEIKRAYQNGTLGASPTPR